MAPTPSPTRTSTRPHYLPLWPLVPQEEVGSEDSLASGLDYCQRKLPGPLWYLGWLGRGGKGREEVLPIAPQTAHRNAVPIPLMSSTTPPSTPTQLTILSLSPLQLGAQDSLSMAGDMMGSSPPSSLAILLGIWPAHHESSCLPGLDQSSQAGVPPFLTLRLWTKRARGCPPRC